MNKQQTTAKEKRQIKGTVQYMQSKVDKIITQ